jgi:hypothetical protein
MARTKPPLLTLGPLSGRIYVVTRYTDKGNGVIDAHEKYDVTSQFMAVKEEAEAKFDYMPVEKDAARA